MGQANRSGTRAYVRSFLLIAIAWSAGYTWAQSVPTFRYAVQNSSYTLVGGDPSVGGTTTIPTVVVPIALSFESTQHAAPPVAIDATKDIPALIGSPLFTAFAFPGRDRMPYVDAMLHATFPEARNWHTILATPQVMGTVHIALPAGSGYVMTSAKSGRSLAIADIEYVQRELFKQVPKLNGKLIIAVTHNTGYYGEGDATLCCSWGTHGSDTATGNSFVLASYLSDAPLVVHDQDVQPLTEQVAEFVNDPLHNPLVRQSREGMPGNRFPAWLRPSSMHPGDQGPCGGTAAASAYFLLEPTDTNRKNNLPQSQAFVLENGRAAYHVQNIALLPWYVGSSGELGTVYSFPDSKVLADPAHPCLARTRDSGEIGPQPEVRPAPRPKTANGHALIGYWTGSGRGEAPFPLREVSPQWDVIIVAFATPEKNAPEGTLRFSAPAGIASEELKSDIARLRSQGKKVLISLGGGGEYFTLDDPKSIANFVSGVGRIVKEYGFDGIDIDFETPSLVLAQGDTDFKHPTTPSIVNLIAALRQLRKELGPRFMISLVPEGPQIPAGHVTYGGQFGSYLPLAYGIRDILSFMDVQDYNTPPLEGLDGEIYQAGTVDYHAALTELVLQGFAVGGDPRQVFPPLPPNNVAVGFLTGETTPQTVAAAMDYIIMGHAPAEALYKLRKSSGYPEMIGAMFWTIDADRREDYRFSNVVGPQLRSFPQAK